jgi:hypothetical protein
MFRISCATSAVVGRFLARWAPSNRLLAAVRTRRGLKWGVPVMGLGLVCFVAAASVSAAVQDGGPGWLHLAVLWLIWDGLKFLWAGPVCLVALARARWRERRPAAGSGVFAG